jgi:LPS export ABC transporter protein LptC
MVFRIFVTLLFTAIIAGSFWLGGQQPETTASTTVQPSSGDLGYSARNAVMVETGPDGVPLYTLNADVIRQHPDDGVEFEQVQMTFRDAEGQTWKGRADHGELATDTGKVDLSGDVHVDGLLPGSVSPVDLATEKMAVDTKQDIISTDDPVVVTSPGRVLKSHGMVATLNEHRLLLESSVHGSYAP